MKSPTRQQLDIAVAWLHSNEGADGESEACKTVAAWLDHETHEKWLRNTARSAGVTVARLRRKLADNRETGREAF